MSDEHTPEAVSRGLVLAGLPGDNPLGFLAALGVLRILSQRLSERGIRMKWVSQGGWRPVIGQSDLIERSPGHEVVRTDGEGLDLIQPAPSLDRVEVVKVLHDALAGRHLAPEFTLVKDGTGEPREIKLSPREFAEVADASVRHLIKTRDRAWADFCAAYGTDADASDPEIAVTDFHFTSGQQSFMGTLRALAGEPPPQSIETPGKRKAKRSSEDSGATTIAHLDHALFEPWSYSDPRPSLRWDPVDDRRYAYRAFDPTNASVSPILTVRGANRLAIEALPWLPTFPCDGDARTRGFSRRSNRDIDFTWPIWDCWLGADTVRSVLGLRELYEDKPRRLELEARGIVEVFRSRRIGGYYRNFSPAIACLGRVPS
jgi:hypothetical protein